MERKREIFICRERFMDKETEERRMTKGMSVSCKKARALAYRAGGRIGSASGRALRAFLKS